MPKEQAMKKQKLTIGISLTKGLFAQQKKLASESEQATKWGMGRKFLQPKIYILTQRSEYPESISELHKFTRKKQNNLLSKIKHVYE